MYLIGLSFGVFLFMCLIFEVHSDTNATQRISEGDAHSPCSENQFRAETGNCCAICPSGTRVKHACAAGNDTACQQCILGESFSAFSNSERNVRVCHECTICPARSVTVSGCNLTADTVCECEEGYYWDHRDKTCRHCQMCNAGFGAIDACKGDRNTHCRRCTDGTFSSRKSTRQCQPCKICGLNELVLQPCSYRQDTICVGLPYSKSTPLLFPYEDLNPDSTTESTDENSSGSKHNIVPLYYALLGGVILILVVYVIVTQRRNCIKKKQTGGKDEEGEVPLTSQSSHKSNTNIYTPQTLTGSAKYPDLPAPQRRLVENMLRTEATPNWRTLASSLGYSEVRVSQFEAMANSEGLTPLSYLLSDWSKQSHLANVSTLARTLHLIGRDDVSRVLLPTNYPKDSQGRMPAFSNQVPRIENVYQSAGPVYYAKQGQTEQRL